LRPTRLSSEYSGRVERSRSDGDVITAPSGAPMISVTHFQDRDGQVLADVTPRRYFCTECHVQQTDARPLVPNTFVDADDVGRKR